MLSLTLLPLPSHLPLQPFPAHAGKNVSGGDAVDRLCERAPSLEIKGDSCFMARRTKGARSKETVAKKKKLNKNLPARELHRRSSVQPYASNEPIFLLGTTTMQSDALLPLSDFPPSSGPPPSSYLTPSSHTGTQWKGIPHYLSSCLAWNIGSLSDVRSHLNLGTNVRHCVFCPE